MARNIASLFTRLHWPREVRKTYADLGAGYIVLYSLVELSHHIKERVYFWQKILLPPGCSFLNRPEKGRFILKALLKTN